MTEDLGLRHGVEGRVARHAAADGPPRARFRALYGNGGRTTALAAALEAGFGSYAQFYRVVRTETGRSPSGLRAAPDDAR